MPGKTNLKSLSKEGTHLFFRDLGLPRYRADQLLHWIYQKFAEDLGDITEFSKDLRETLSRVAYISSLKTAKRLSSADGTGKFLFSLEDGNTIESVLIPDEDRLTLCISSQVGCAMGCRFCLTGRLGLIRNLRAFEIVDQVISVNKMLHPAKRVTNIVFMGMGEPLANLEEVVDALWRITGFIGISKRKITLSTAGLVPAMLLLPQKAPEVNLAVSLNATTDATRDELMPVNRTYKLRSLLEACRRYPLSPRRMITFEYVLIDGKNSSAADARRLVQLLRGLRCKVNLIPLNPHAGSDLKRPSDSAVLEFQKILLQHDLTALIRESKGSDILAACGQLKAEY
ncbi:MAG: 23S rRNA (adenine(2503)-C(2))-methyltransferase RlmN [Nitrospirae bacterium]|nr:23S rRNA (adenine(2503)-C(2))-methyltransferase RlmN [Nitrospirota bacterium]